MNVLSIKNFADYRSKLKMFRVHGKFKNYTFELSPAVIEITPSVVEEICKNLVENWEVPHEFSLIQKWILDVAKEGIDFTEIKGSEYIGDDYVKVGKVFDIYCYEKYSMSVTRRQYAYSFGEKLCMNGIQFFEDYGHIIVNFRSCDYIKKLPFDLLMIILMCKERNVKVDKIFCNFGSLHYYDADTWKIS